MRGDSRIGVEARGEGRRVGNFAAVVGDDAAVGAARHVAQLDLGAEAGEGRAQAEGEQLQRHRRAERADRLARVGDDDEAPRRRGDDLLALVGGPAALDQPAVGGDLVGAVDRDVEARAASRTPRPGSPASARSRSRPRSRRSGSRSARGRRSRAAGGRRSSRCRGRSSSRPRPAPPRPRRRSASRRRLPRARTRCSRGDGRSGLVDGKGRGAAVVCGGRADDCGRDPEAGVPIDDEAVSWHHLEIETRGGVSMATDLDSRNGTALNGEPLDRPRRLRDGDVLTVVDYRLEFSEPVPGEGDGCDERAGGRAQRGGAGDRVGARRALPQRGRLRRPSRHPGRARRGAPRQRAHRPAPPRRARRQARRPRRRRPRAPPFDRRARHRARPRPLTTL